MIAVPCIRLFVSQWYGIVVIPISLIVRNANIDRPKISDYLVYKENYYCYQNDGNKFLYHTIEKDA